MRIRIRGPTGQSIITLPETANIGDLQEQVMEKTRIASFEIKYGYPPKPLGLDGYSKSSVLSDLDVKLDGEQLIVSEKSGTSSVPKPASGLLSGSSSQQGSAPPAVNSPSKTTLREIPPSF